MRKNIKHPVTIIMLSIISSSLYSNIIISSSNSNGNSNNVSALTYQQSTDLEFTFNSTISLTVSGDLNIEELTPGDSSDSNIIDINVSTNNVSGYNLSATVGNTTNPSTNLTHTNNSTYKFTSLTTDTTTLSDFDPNTWGYSYSIDNGTTWISNPTGTLGYSHLPLYTTTATTLKQNYNPASDTINFKIAAKASNIQPSGAYTNTINFTATANPEVRYYMHEFTNDICRTLASDNNYTVYDIRDNSDYTVRYINDACWMTQNLRITGTISSQYSNFTGEDINISQKDLDETVGDCSGNSCNSLDIPMTHNSNDPTIGVWYNYAAASAGTVTGSSNSVDTTEDACPLNWFMPIIGGRRDPGTFENIMHYSTPNIFAVSVGGYYNNGFVSEPNTGTWWSSTTYSVPRSTMYYKNGGLNNGNMPRSNGVFVRCARVS